MVSCDFYPRCKISIYQYLIFYLLNLKKKLYNSHSSKYNAFYENVTNKILIGLNVFVFMSERVFANGRIGSFDIRPIFLIAKYQRYEV